MKGANMSANTAAPIQHNPPETDKTPRTFTLFGNFSEDIRFMILSFVADAPHEISVPGPLRYQFKPSSLTTTLPLVSKEFSQFARHDSLWLAALTRQLQHPAQQGHWKGGLRRLLPLECEVKDSTILQSVQEELGGAITYREIYRKVFSNHIQFEAPVFIMPSPVEIGEIYGLHLFEPRYRFMVRDILNSCQNPQSARQGEPIEPGTNEEGMIQPPYIIHFCLPQRIRPGALACLVQIVWCRTYEQETADVQLMPVAWVRLENLFVRPEYGHLFYAKATRI